MADGESYLFQVSSQSGYASIVVRSRPARCRNGFVMLAAQEAFEE